MRGTARWSLVLTILLVSTAIVVVLPTPGETLSGGGGEAGSGRRARSLSHEPIITLSPSLKANNTTFTITATAASAFFVDGDTELFLDGQVDDQAVSVGSVTFGSTTSVTASVTVAVGAADQWVTLKCRAGSGMIIERAAFRIDGSAPSATVISFSDVINLAPTGTQTSITLYSADAAFASGDFITTDNGNITIDNTTYTDTSHWDVDLTVGTSATLGDVKVDISNGGTTQSLAYLFIVDDTPADAKLVPNVGKVQEAINASDVYIGEPSIFAHNGEYITSATDLTIRGRGFDFVWTRTYRSQVNYLGPYGGNWTTNYNLYVFEDAQGDVYFWDGTGRMDLYTESAGVYTPPAGFYTKMEKISSVFKITDSKGTVYDFGLNSKISKITERNGNYMTFYYDSADYLQEIEDTLGRSILFYYTTDGYLEEISDFALRSVKYTYGSSGELTSVTSPSVDVSIDNDYLSGKKTEYTYTTGSPTESLNYNLLTIKRPREVASSGSAYLTNTYHAIPGVSNFDWLDKQTKDGNDIIVTHNFGTKTTTVKDRELNETDYINNASNNPYLDKKREKTRGLRFGEPSYFETQYTHNTETEITDIILPLSNKRTFAYDHTNSDHRSRGNPLTITNISDIPGVEDDQVYVRTFSTDGFNMEKTFNDPFGTWTHVFDAYGNKTKTTAPSVTSGQPASQTIEHAWTYNTWGQVTKYTDPESNTTDYTYYTSGTQDGYLKDVTVDSGGGNLQLKTAYEYDLVGNVTKITDPELNVTTFEVNELNQTVLTTLPKPTGDTNAPQIRTYWDENDLREKGEVRNLDEDGVAYSDEWIVQQEHVFNIMNKPTSTKQEVSSGVYVTTSFTYDKNDMVKQITFPELNKTLIEYDERRLPFKMTRGYGSADASTVRRDYDRNGNLEKLFGGESSSNELYTYAYDGFDRKTKATDVLNHYTEWEYEDCCVIIKKITKKDSANKLLEEITYFHDQVRRRYKVEMLFKDSGGTNVGDGISRSEFLFDKSSRLTEVKDDNLHKTYHYYDGANRRTKTVDHIGESTGNFVLSTFDDNGNITKVEEKEYNQKTSSMETFRTDFTYDALDRRIKTQVDPTALNLISEVKYDSRSNIVWQDDEEDTITTHTYDHRSLRTKTIHDDTTGGLKITIEHGWDDNSRADWQEDGNDNKTTYAYDDLDRPKTITYADNETETITYNKLHNVKTVTDPNGSVLTNTMNDLGWVTSVSIFPLGTGVGGTDSVTNTFDGLGRITEAIEKEGATQTSKVKYFFDTMGQVDKEEQYVGALSVRTIERTYDGVGIKTDLKYPDTRTIDFVYDTVNRLDQVKDGTTVIADYFSRGGAFTQRDYDNDTKLEVTFDAARRITDYDHKRLNQDAPPVWVVHAGFDYAWHKDSTRKYEDRTHDSKGDAYRYDDIDEVTGVKYGVTNLSSSSSYSDYTTFDSKEEPTYDDVGNRKTVGNGTTVKYNHVADVYTADNMNEIYDIDGTSRIHDDNGNLTDDGTNKFEYDYRNRVIKVINTVPNPDETVAEYEYDATNRRIKKVVTNSGSLNGTTLFFYDDWQVIEEQDGSGNKTAQYVYGRGIDEVLQMQRDVEGDSNFETYYFHTNSMDSIEMLTDSTTNDVVEEYDYKAFGDFTTPQSLSGLDNPYHWQGRRYDSETGLYYFRNRYYDPETGRFLERDPEDVWPDSGNREVGNPIADAIILLGNPYLLSQADPWWPPRRYPPGLPPGTLIWDPCIGLMVVIDCEDCQGANARTAWYKAYADAHPNDAFAGCVTKVAKKIAEIIDRRWRAGAGRWLCCINKCIFEKYKIDVQNPTYAGLSCAMKVRLHAGKRIKDCRPECQRLTGLDVPDWVHSLWVFAGVRACCH
ncbi:MAG: DUF6531 domain-containing protein [Planctomycetota bacterium]|nr:DUF6531 domain-containing protein [Planctomycetota bacterium]